MQRKRLGLILRIAAITIAGTIALVVALVTLIPADVYRDSIEQAARSATGRALHLRGALGFTVYPEIGISVSDVTFANAPGARDPEMASVHRMIVGVRLLPLLSRRVEVTRLLLEKPVVHIEVAKDGTGNWVFTTGKSEFPKEGGATANFSLSNLRVRDGSFSYFDARTGKAQTFDKVDITIATTSLDQPFSVTGAANYRGHKVDIAGKLGNLGAALNQVETPAIFSLSSDVVKVSLEGAVGGKATASGKLHLEMPSLRQFANWFEVSLPPGKGLGKMKLDAVIAVEPQAFSASNIKLALDEMNVTGDFRLKTGGARPAIAGKLAIDRLDLNTYMPAKSVADEESATKPAAPAANWSDTPISFDMLKAVDADLGLSVGQLLVSNLEVQKAQMAVTLKDGVLNSNLQHMVLYQGSGKGSLLVDARGSTPKIKNTLSVSGLEVERFLTAFMRIERIDGTGNMSFDVTAQGASQKAIITSLAGKGEITFRDGMIKGVDLAAVARTVQSALTGASVGERAATDFAELGGTFTMKEGVMTNTDFRLLNPFIRMSGEGTIDLGNRSMDFHIEPKLVAATQGQGGQAALAGVGIPFRISGPWTKLSYGPDMKNVGKTLTNALLDKLAGTTKENPSTPTNTGIGGLLKGLFGQ